jgi:hypothetical protein
MSTIRVDHGMKDGWWCMKDKMKTYMVRLQFVFTYI